MHPGCQSILKHRVLLGDSSGSDDQIRYSISFRRSSSTPLTISNSELPASEDSPNVTLIPTSLLVGDSLLARLDPERLGKGKKTILDLTKGGNKICNVIDSLKAFIADSGSEKYLVNQVFVSVGTNDVRFCKNGISHLKGELFGLVRTIKNFFPGVKVYLQSLLPLPVTFSNKNFVIKNVLELKRIIYHVCYHERIFMLDIFKTFLFRGYRHPSLFPPSTSDIHPNRRGLGVMAREYINIIHSRHFDPLRPN